MAASRRRGPGLVFRYAVLLALFGVLPLAASIVIGTAVSARLITSSVERRLQSLGELKLEQARAQATRRSADARMVSRLGTDLARDLDTALVERPSGAGLPAELQGRLSRWLRAQAATLGEDVELHLVGLDGIEMARSQLTVNHEDWSGRPGVAEGRHRTWAGGPGYAGPSGPSLTAVATPFRTAAGRTVGELVLLDGSGSLERWLETEVELPVSLELRDFHGRDVASWPEGADRDRREDVIRAAVPVRPGGGTLIVRSPRSRALAALLVLRDVGIAGMVGGTALSVLIATWLGRRLTRPLLRLSRIAKRIGEGDLAPFELERRDDEVGDLYRSAEEMRRALLAATEKRESLLHQRTRALADREGLIDSLFEVLPEYVVVLDESFHVLAANRTARRLHGASPLGSYCHEAIFGRSEPCPDCPLVAGGPERHAEREPQLPNRFGEVMVFQAQEIEGAPGSSRAWVYTGRIVTEQRRLRAQVIHQEKMAMTGVLAAGVAHEVGNPLASMLSILQLAGRPGEAIEQPQIDLLREQVERISSVVKGLLGVARTSSMRPGPVLVNRTVERAVQLARYDPRSGAGTLECEVDDDVPVVWAVEDRLLQALLNVLINALDAVEGQPAPRVVASTRSLGDDLEITVRDNGSGMDAQTLARACDPLFTTKPPGRGTGLGLHVTREILDEIGGALRLASQLGEGTTVTLRLPGHRPEPALAEGS